MAAPTYTWWIALSFMIVSTLLTIHQIRLHLHWNTSPRLRRYIIRIICMVPIYAFTSWLGLTNPDVSLYFDFIRECYEAFVIYCFFQLLVQWLGGEERLAYRLAGKEVQAHQVPCCCLPDWQMVEWETMTREEKEKVRCLIDQQKTEMETADLNKAAAAAEESKQVEETGVHDEGGLKAVEEEDEVILQHPPNAASSSSPPPESSPPPHPTHTATSSTSSISSFFRSSQPPTPKQPSQYIAHSLAHQTVSNPFTPHPLTAEGSPFSSFSSLPSSPPSPSSSTTPTRLPYLYSPFLFYTQLGTLQYCVLKPILALFALVLSLLGSYGEGKFSASVGYPYIAFITNISQIWAMYCLILFYLALKEDLAPIRPVPKFVVVKAVVFFTWWQSVLFAGFEWYGLISDTTMESELQDFVVCVEMVIAAIAHHYYFTYKDFYDPSAPLIIAPMFHSMFEVVNVRDVFVDDVDRIRRKHKHRERKKEERRKKSEGFRALTEQLLNEEEKDGEEEENGHEEQVEEGEGGMEEKTAPKALSREERQKQNAHVV